MFSSGWKERKSDVLADRQFFTIVMTSPSMVRV